MNNRKIVLALVILACIFGYMGHMQHEDEQKETAHYCDMVRGGHWPDFKGWYQRVCPAAVKPSQSARNRRA